SSDGGPPAGAGRAGRRSLPAVTAAHGNPGRRRTYGQSIEAGRVAQDHSNGLVHRGGQEKGYEAEEAGRGNEDDQGKDGRRAEAQGGDREAVDGAESKEGRASGRERRRPAQGRGQLVKGSVRETENEGVGVSDIGDAGSRGVTYAHGGTRRVPFARDDDRADSSGGGEGE